MADHAGEQAREGAAEDVPGLRESLRQVGATGRAGLAASGDALKALRILVAADVSLARSAFGRTLALTGVAVVFGASAWLLLMTALVVWLSLGLGWPWSLSLLLTAALSLAAAALAVRQGMHYFEHTRLQATRRQLARLGVGELAAFMPAADSNASTAQAAERMAEGEAPPKKGLGIDVTPP
jgi:hypothetical protein